jgi:hypothetical protein
MWDVNEKEFHVGTHTLIIDIEDIYFLTGLSHFVSRVTLIGSRGGSEPMNYYVSHHCVSGTRNIVVRSLLGMSDIFLCGLSSILLLTWKGGSSPHGSAEPFSVCIGVYGALSLQLVRRGPKNNEETTYQV